MNGTTISGSYTTGITLSNPATQNPVTVSGMGRIAATSGSALYGTNVAAWSVYNFGTLIAPSAGVVLKAGGIIDNESTGLISGYRGVDVSGGQGAVSNAGTIEGGTLQGIRLTAGGSVTNATGGHIAGGGTYAAVYIRDGGSVGNAAGATIAGQVAIYDATGTVANAGLIIGAARPAIMLAAGGSMTNAAGGTVAGAVQILGAAGTVMNAGSIATAASAASAVELTDGGVVNNMASAVISGGSTGIHLPSGTVTNAGSISGTTLGISGGASITNSAGGMIYGGKYGIYHFGNLTNAGTVNSNKYSIAIVGYGNITNLSGGVIGSNGETGVLLKVPSPTVLNAGFINGIFLDAGGTVTNQAGGTITAIVVAGTSSSLLNGGTVGSVYMNMANASVTNTAGGLIDGIKIQVFGTPGGTVSNGGLLTGGLTALTVDNLAGGTISSGASATSAGLLANAGVISGNDVSVGHLIVDPGAQFSGTISGSSATNGPLVELAPGAGGRLAGFGSSIINFSSIAFDTGAEWTIAGNTAGLSGTISGFASGDTIDLVGLSETIEVYNAGILTLTGDRTVELQLPGTFTTASFATGPDTATGTDVFLACFAAGTRIATGRGDVTVEHLRAGDQVLTLADDGTLVPRPVCWIGRRRIDLTRHPRAEQVCPIRICRDAFADNVPNRDLLLSPDHAIHAEGVLIPVRYLVNSRSILPVRQVHSIEYFHVELDQHAILMADNMPVESYLDTGDRSSFENGGAHIALHPEFAVRRWEARGCAPLVVAGPEVTAVRGKLARRAWRRPARARVA